MHRNQLARQTRKSYEKVFSDSVTMGIVCGKESVEECKNKDYVFAMIQTLSRDENLKSFAPDYFQAIILDEYDIIGLSREAA